MSARHPFLFPRVGSIALIVTLVVFGATSRAEDPLDSALASITADELFEHVATLADDVFEGRAVGSQGGRAAGQYIVAQLQQLRAKPAGIDGEFCQPCDRGGRNILAIWPAADAPADSECIIVGAHYDHVGDGRQGRVRGAIGQIYNGADDNASGVAVLLELIEALSENAVPTRRSILFAFWDGEEQGMLGSHDWIAQPTVPLSSVRLAINVDMVGRLRDGRLQVLGTRTGYGLRRLLSGSVAEPLRLDFSWELAANSDHWPFVERQIPIVMLHTGMHDDYHRPSDDADKINRHGLEQIGRYLLATVVEAANVEQLPNYRPAGRTESLAAQRRWQRQLSRVSRSISTARRSGAGRLSSKPGRPQLSEPGHPRLSEPGRPRLSEPGRPRPRLGISWRTDDAEPGSVYLTHVVADSPAAAAGLAVGMRIYALNGQPFADSSEFRDAVIGLLGADEVAFTMTVETRGHVRTVSVRWQPPTLVAKSST